MAVRGKTFTMRLKADESERLNKLALFYGVNASTMIRMMLKEEERRVYPKSAGKGLPR